MKKLLFALSLVIFSLACFGQADSTGERLYSPQQLKADLDTIYKWVTETHPSLYLAVSREQADKTWKSVAAQLDRPMTRLQFLRKVSIVLSQYMDGHTGFAPEFDLPEFELFTKQGGKIFPLQVMVQDNRIWCVENYRNDGVIVRGDEIVAINGTPAKKIISALTPLWPADNAASKEVMLSRLFNFSIWLYYGWGNKVEAEVKKSNGRVKVGVQGMAAAEYLDHYFRAIQTWQLAFFPEHGLAIIKSGRYAGSMKAARAFLDSAFALIKEKGIQHVALDIRTNGGGNSQLGRMVLGYVSQKPSTATVSKTFRSSALIESLPEKHYLNAAYGRARKNWTAVPNGYTLTFAAEEAIVPENKELLFRGKFYLLTSPRTFSSAHMTAMEVKCFGLGTIIGEPTGERLNLSGEILEVFLPNTGLPALIPTAAYKTACGDGNAIGVQPDVLVKTRAVDLLSGKDPVVERLKLMCRQ